MTFWKQYPPGWFVYEYDWEGDGDGGRDYEAEREEAERREREREEEEEREREREREERRREEERRRREEEERRRREEEERQRRLEEQRRQIEEEQRRQQEEQDRLRAEEEARAQSEDSDGDGIPDRATLEAPGVGESTDPGAEQRLEEQFQTYEEQRQAQEQAFNPENPGWIYQSEETRRERTPQQATTNRIDPTPIDRETPVQNPREVGREYTPSGVDRAYTANDSDPRTAGPSYQLPATLRPAAPEPEREPLPTPVQERVPEIAATAAAEAAARAGGTPVQIAQTAETAARMASDRQTLAGQSAWTRAAFRSQYGDQAEAEWARQHEAELARNQRLYGATEPRAGSLPLASAPVGTPMAPDRRIGATPSPSPGQEARYGINVTPRPQPTPAPSPQTARQPAPGVTGPTTQGPSQVLPSATAPLAPPAVPGAPSVIGDTGAPPVAPRPIGAPSALPAYRPPEGPSRERGTLPPMVPTAPAITPSGGGLSPADQAEMDAAQPVPLTPEPYDPRVYDEGPREDTGEGGANIPGLRSIPGEPTTQQARATIDGIPITTRVRNIVDYDPVTGQTTERGFEQERYASEDTAIPSAAGMAAPAYADPVLASISTDRPLATLATLAAQSRGSDYDPRQDAAHIAHGVAGMLRGDRDAVWAEPYLNDVARIAWAREERQNGRGSSDPRNAPVEYVERWKDAFYGSDHTVPMVKEIDQEMIDHAAARTPPGQPFRWQEAYGPTGEKGLISQQVTAVDCGPNAFSTILRSRGYNADPAQTFRFARETGYHDGNQFTGPANMVRMLREEAGLNASSVPVTPGGQGWERVDAELAAGRPVMLSSPGHYWVVSAKDPNTGKYYAGATTLKGNPQWMARGGFSYGGAANTAIFADGDVDPNSRSVQRLGLKPPVKGQANTRPFLSGQTEYEGAPQRTASSTATAPANASTTAAGSASTPGSWVHSPGANRIPEPYRPFVEEAATVQGVDPDWIAAMMVQESGGNPAALSPKGASGLLQLMPGTARAMGVTDPRDPRQNIQGGVKYFKQMLDQHGGNPQLALAAYNAGPGAVAQYRGIPPYAETQHYVKTITANYEAIKRERQERMASIPPTPGKGDDSGSELMMLRGELQPSDQVPTGNRPKSAGYPAERVQSVGDLDEWIRRNQGSPSSTGAPIPRGSSGAPPAERLDPRIDERYLTPAERARIRMLWEMGR